MRLSGRHAQQASLPTRPRRRENRLPRSDEDASPSSRSALWCTPRNVTRDFDGTANNALSGDYLRTGLVIPVRPCSKVSVCAHVPLPAESPCPVVAICASNCSSCAAAWLTSQTASPGTSLTAVRNQSRT
jgi:hypothetical protein